MSRINVANFRHPDGTSDNINLDSSGRVGIGTASPETPLHIESSGETIALIEGNSTIGAVLGLKNNSTTANHYSQIQGVDAGGQTVSAINFYNTDNANNEGFITALTRPSGGLPTEVFRLDSSGNLKFNSGYGSVATAYGCRAWVNFNGTGTVAIRASGNVSSITDHAVGTYTLNFTTALADANYSLLGTVGATSGSAVSVFPNDNTTARTTTAARIVTVTTTGGAADSEQVAIAIFR